MPEDDRANKWKKRLKLKEGEKCFKYFAVSFSIEKKKKTTYRILKEGKENYLKKYIKSRSRLPKIASVWFVMEIFQYWLSTTTLTRKYDLCMAKQIVKTGRENA